jgi:hypothetical protein
VKGGPAVQYLGLEWAYRRAGVVRAR